MRNQTSREQEIACRWNVIASLVPEVRQAQQRNMEQEGKKKDNREYQCRICAGPMNRPTSLRPVVFQNLPPGLAVSDLVSAAKWLLVSAPGLTASCAGRV